LKENKIIEKNYMKRLDKNYIINPVRAMAMKIPAEMNGMFKETAFPLHFNFPPALKQFT
jgi:hypothetical protein